MSIKCMILILFFAFSANVMANQAVITHEVIAQIEKQVDGWTKRRFVAWDKIIRNNANKPDLAKLKIVNRFFNLFQYRSDAESVGRTDHWMTPVEFIKRGGGDCEDFSIVKYFTLLALKIPEQKLRIMYVKALKYNYAHMVLGYYATPDAEPLILDNINGAVLPAAQRKDLQPIYSFNGSGLWAAKLRGQGSRLGSAKKISLWQELNQRMLRELKQ